MFPAIVLMVLPTLFAGCTAARHEARWGANVRPDPGWERAREAAVESMKSEAVWASLAAAVILRFTEGDRRISDWARREMPLAGSARRAARLSDDLARSASIANLTTALAAVSGVDAESWVTDKAKGVAVGIVAVGVSMGATSQLKEHTSNLRPDRSNRKSLPSGHATLVASTSTLAERNLEYVRLSSRWQMGADVALTMITLGCAWSRVEGGKHYPSDTLIGIAIGGFLAGFIDQVFMGDVGVHFSPDESRAGIRLRF